MSETGMDPQTRTERYDRLNILDRKCQALLQLSSLVIGVNVLAPAIGRVGAMTRVASVVAVLAFLVTGLFALSVLWIEWEPEPDTILGRTLRYRLAVVSTGIGLSAMAIFVLTALSGA